LRLAKSAAKKIVDAIRVHNGGHYALALPTTVETYRARMMEKLDIRDFATLVKFAI
jgi:FixJ family two-component response regulator